MQLFNLLLATLGSAMSVVLLVVVLIYYVYTDVKPALADDIPVLWLSAGLFGLIALVGWTAVWARSRAHRGRLVFELALAVTTALVLTTLVAVYR